MPHEHTFCIVERVDDDRAGVSKSDLEDRLTISPPPTLADCGVVLAEFEEVSDYWPGTWYFWDAFDLRDVCRD